MENLSSISKEELDQLTDVYTDAEISAKFGFSRTAATYFRKKYNIRSYSEKTGNRKYKDFYPTKSNQKRVFSYKKNGANENYFELLDTNRKAYWLGLIAADGWIVTEKKKPTGFGIALKKEDSYLLKQFAIDLGCPSMYRKERIENNLWQVKFSSEKIASDLIKLKIVPRKSKVLEIPQLSFPLFSSWLRGYFDGDGSVSIRKNTLSVKITSGSKLSLTGIKELLFQYSIKTSITKDGDTYNLCAYTKNALKFGSIIYANMSNQVCLERKKKVFDEFKTKV
jgi:hypothetical protein